MTSMGEEPVSEEEFQAFAKVVILSQNVLGIWRKVKYIQYCQQVLPSNDEGLLDYEGEKSSQEEKLEHFSGHPSFSFSITDGFEEEIVIYWWM